MVLESSAQFDLLVQQKSTQIHAYPFESAFLQDPIIFDHSFFWTRLPRRKVPANIEKSPPRPPIHAK
jgi:hypothetical protein